MSARTTRLLILGWYALLAIVWAMTNPPFAAPDEAAHYLRALGISDGSLVGVHAHLSGPGLDVKLVIPHEPSALQLAWVNQATRSVSVPAGLSPDGFNCEARRSQLSAACTRTAAENRASVHEITPVGTYQPFPYLLPAVVLRLDDHAAGSVRLARLATIAMWLALLTATIYALWDGTLGAASLSGLMLAITPTVIFIGSSLNGSSLEVMGSIAFFATLLGLARPSADRRSITTLMLLAGATGLVLALSRSLGPLWVALDVALAVLLCDLRQMRSRIAASRAAALVAGASVLAGVVLNRYWEALYGPHTSITLLPSLASLRAGVRSLFNTQTELIGKFGYLNVPLPHAVEAAWWLLAAALVIAGVRMGQGRQRRVLLIAVALAIFIPVYLEAAVLRNTGYGLQGRHYLPFVALLPIMAFEIVRQRASSRVRLRQAFTVIVLATTVMQLCAWWINSRRYAVGSHGPLWFLSSAQWSPPLGWIPWIVVLVGAACALAFGASKDPERGLAGV